MSGEECCYFVNQSGTKEQEKRLRELEAELGKRYITSSLLGLLGGLH